MAADDVEAAAGQGGIGLLEVDEVALSRCDGAELRVVFRSKLSEAGGLFAADLRAFMRETDLPASVRGR